MDLAFDLVEYVMLFALAVGVFFALAAPSQFSLYLVALISGLFFGRVLWKWKSKGQVPVFIVIAGFFLGFSIGGFFASLRVLFLVFFLGILAGYFAHRSSGLALG